jgi:prolipoprotein diacylglyceryl transferase
MLPLSIPSPSKGVVHLGPLPIRGYALCIIAGIIVCVWLAERRWKHRGGRPGQVQDVALWAVPFGLVGARLYSLATDSDRYFGKGHAWWQPFAIWQGGIGVWGAIAFGGVGAWIACRRMGIRLPALADVLAPCILVAQGIGRWGNWFNQELYGKATTLPWGLKIDQEHWPTTVGGQNVSVPADVQHDVGTTHAYATFHPTFLYECVWDLGAAGLVFWLDRRFKLGHGRAFALYAMIYCLGRAWIEYLRVDSIEHTFLGLRLNDWTCLIVFLGALIYFVVSSRLRPGREQSLYAEGREPVAEEPSSNGAEGA